MLTLRQLVFHTSLSHRPRHAIVSEVEWFNIFNFNIRSLSHVDLFLLTPRTPGDQSLIRREIISWSTLKVEQLKIKEPCVKILSCGHLCKKQPYHWKVTKGGGFIFNPKIYVADFGSYKQGFLSVKLIQKSNFRIQGMFVQQLYWEKSKQDTLWGRHVHAFHTIWPTYLLADTLCKHIHYKKIAS